MRSVFRCAVVFFTLVTVLQDSVAEDDAIGKSALEFQLMRFNAMIDVDTESLEAYLADDLTYSHTTGWTETKSEFLTTVQSGKINYMSITPTVVQVRIYGQIAVMTGVAQIQGKLGDKPLSFTIRFLDVSRRVSDSWQLVAWQSVKVLTDKN